jgi:hypothetical protein
MPQSFTHQISISQLSTFSIDFAYYCFADCSTKENTEILIRPMVLNMLVNAQESSNYKTEFVQERIYYTINTQISSVDTVLNF